MKKGTQFVIGGFKLSVDAYAASDMSHGNDYRWAQHDRIGNASTTHQYLGEGVETIKLNGTVNLINGGSMYQLDSLKSIAEKGEPQIVTLGTGKVLGKFIIKKINSSYDKLMDDGRAIHNKFSIDLTRYKQ